MPRENLLSETEERMKGAIEHTRKEFASIRTGRATTALLDTVHVNYYGSNTPLAQVASVSAPEPRLLVVQPWDKSLLSTIEKAIMASELGLNPASDGNILRVPIPALNEERRREMVKLLHKLAEEGRVAIRHARQEANKGIKAAEQAHEIGEDLAHRQMDEVQKMTDEYIGKVDALLKAKEQEVMEV